MTDDNTEATPPDLDLIAQLISESSLGSVDALAAQNDVPPDIAMALRDKVCLDAPARRWEDVIESAVVLREVARVVPHFDGSFDYESQPFLDQPCFAINRRGDYRSIDTSCPRLPGGAGREQWTLFQPANGAYRCTVAFRYQETRFQPTVWQLEAAIWWELIDPKKAATLGLVTIDWRLLQSVFEDLTVTRPPASVGEQMRFEQAMQRALQERGVNAECAIRFKYETERSDHRLQPTLAAPNSLEVHRRLSRSIHGLMREIRESGEVLPLLPSRVTTAIEGMGRRGVDRPASELLEALRLMGCDVDLAIDITVATLPSIRTRFTTPGELLYDALAVEAARQLYAHMQDDRLRRVVSDLVKLDDDSVVDAGEDDVLDDNEDDIDDPDPLAHTPPGARTLGATVSMLVMQGHKPEQIAETLGLSVEEVRAALRQHVEARRDSRRAFQDALH